MNNSVSVPRVGYSKNVGKKWGPLPFLPLQDCLFHSVNSILTSRMSTPAAGKCPFVHATAASRKNADWWPKQLNLAPLHQHNSKSNPMGNTFDYAEEFKKLDMTALDADLRAVMTDSKEW